MNIQIIKRDGSKEPFQSEKISRVVQAAGLSPEKAKILIANVETWLKTLNVSEISSLGIRDRVISELEKQDSYAANMFSWYQKTKETPA